MKKSDKNSSNSLDVLVIKPPKGLINVDLKELWRYRELFGFFVWRDIKVKYKQTLLGAAWAVLVPFFQMMVFAFIFGRVAKLPSDGLPPSIFYYAALLPWTYFATSMNMSSQSMVGNAHLLTKIYLPRLIVPTGPCIAGLVDFLIAFTIMVGMMFYYHIIPPLTVLLLPILLFIAFGTALGTGLFFSALNVKYRDVRHMMSFIVQMWMYCTVIIPFSKIPEKFGVFRYLYGLNPMAGVVEGFRWCLLHTRMFIEKNIETPIIGNILPENLVEGQKVVVKVSEDNHVQAYLSEVVKTPVEPPFILIGIGIMSVIVIFTFGLYYFKRTEKMFADIV